MPKLEDGRERKRERQQLKNKAKDEKVRRKSAPERYLAVNDPPFYLERARKRKRKRKREKSSRLPVYNHWSWSKSKRLARGWVCTAYSSGRCIVYSAIG